MISVLIVDDHRITRAGLVRILSDYPEAVEVGEAGSVAEALRLVAERQWNLVLLDIALPDGNGIDVLKTIKRDHPQLPVLVLSMYSVDQYGLRVLRAGGMGYLTKESAPEQLLQAVNLAVRGERFITTELVARLSQEPQRTSASFPHECLSDRELEVLRLIASGKRPAEIAGQLSLSVKTVSTYRGRILQKMRMRHNAELTHYAVVNRLVY
jgi:two-component system, NarL family, invasion response regulator UvrY